jgi:hypothetical protein
VSLLRRTGSIALLYFLATLVLTYPLSLHPASLALGLDADSNLYLWTLAWDVHAFLSQPLAIFDANIYFPERHTLAYSENLIGSALVAAPVIWLTGNAQLALNVATLLSCALCGLGVYVLARRLGAGLPAAALGGLIYAFAPPRFLRIGQLHLTAVQWLPFALAYLHTYFEYGRRRDLRVAVFFFSWQALASGHGAVFAVMSIAALFVHQFVRGTRVEPGRWLKDLGVAGLVLLIPTLLVTLPYFAVQEEMGLRRTLGDYPPATAVSFLASPTYLHRYIQSFMGLDDAIQTASAFLFPGYLTLALAGAAFVPGAGPNAARWLYLAIAILGVWLAVGPPLGLWPSVYWLPGLNFIRVPSRFTILALLGLSVLAAFGFERAVARAGGRGRLIAAAIAALILVCEFAVVPFGTVERPLELPGVDRWLASQVRPFAIAEVPVPRPEEAGWERRQSEYMLHSMAHWQKTVHGYSGFRPPVHELLFRQLRTFPDETSLEHLRRLGIRYVVVHRPWYSPDQLPLVDQRLEQFQDGLRLEFEDESGRVYSLR